MARKSGKIDNIQEILKDYRHPSYVKHKLQDILSICILGFLADCNEWEEIADFARQKEKWLKKYLELPNGMPSSDTIRIVAGKIDTAYFYRAVIQSMEALVNDVHTAVKGEEAEAEILSMDRKERL